MRTLKPIPTPIIMATKPLLIGGMSEFDTVTEIILYVQDIDRLTTFYTDVFGLDLKGGHPDHGFVKFDTGQCSLCLHEGGDGDLGRSAPKVTFAVDDIESARAYLADHDVELGEVRSEVPGKEICDGRDPEGHKFSLEAEVD